MTQAELNQGLEEWKEKIKNNPTALPELIEEGKKFYNNGNYCVATALYTTAIECGYPDFHKQRWDALGKWLKS